MKKLFILFVALFMLIVSGCSNKEPQTTLSPEVAKSIQEVIESQRNNTVSETSEHEGNNSSIKEDENSSALPTPDSTIDPANESSTNESDAVKAQPESNYEIPYCSGDFSKIGEVFSSFHVAGSGLQYGPGSMAILLKQQYPLNCPGIGAYYECWDAYADYNGYGSKIGVYNDRIVFNIQDLGSGVTLSEALPDDMLSIEPLIIYGYDSNGYIAEQMVMWKGDNGYSIGFTSANGYPNGSYLDEKVKFFISTIDLNHIYGIPEEVLDANPKFDN